MVGSIFSSYYSALVVATSLNVKILQVNRQTLLGTFNPPREDEEFTMLAAKGDRRFYLSSTKGIIYEHKIEDGSLVKRI